GMGLVPEARVGGVVVRLITKTVEAKSVTKPNDWSPVITQSPLSPVMDADPITVSVSALKTTALLVALSTAMPNVWAGAGRAHSAKVRRAPKKAQCFRCSGILVRDLHVA